MGSLRVVWNLALERKKNQKWQSNLKTHVEGRRSWGCLKINNKNDIWVSRRTLFIISFSIRDSSANQSQNLTIVNEHQISTPISPVCLESMHGLPDHYQEQEERNSIRASHSIPPKICPSFHFVLAKPSAVWTKLIKAKPPIKKKEKDFMMQHNKVEEERNEKKNAGFMMQ